MRLVFAYAVICCTACTRDPAACTAPTTPGRHYVVTKLILPQQRSDFAHDLNGDGKPDDQLGNVVGAITGGGFGAQEYVDAALAAGQDSMELQLYEDDKGDAAATFGETASGHQLGAFCSPTGSTFFTSVEPSLVKAPVELGFTLSFADDVTVTLTGAHLQFSIQGNEARGELHGAVRDHEMHTVVVAGIADLMTKKIQGDPNASNSIALAQFFDTGDPQTGEPCVDPDGTQGMARDGVISPCEVALNALARNVLASDVDLFDDAGVYHPNPKNDGKDSLSVGVGFIAELR